MKNYIESVLLDLIKNYLHENKENLFKFPHTTLEVIANVIHSFELNCELGKLGVSNENN